MKIIHLNYSDLQGGASIASYRLHKSLKKKKINSKMVVAKKLSNDNSVYSFKNNLEKFIFNLKKNLSRFFSKTLELNSNNNYSVSFFNSKLFKVVKSLDPDIVNLHWICNETISINEVKKLKKKIVWTLTDMWPFLAIEHISYNFNKKDYWNDKKILNSNKLSLKHLILKSKINKFNFNFKVVAISAWLANQAKKSILFKDKDIIVIPCCLDFDEWSPVNKIDVRKKFKLGLNKKIILFVSSGNTNDKKKGFEILLNAFKKIKNKSNYHLIILGKLDDNHKKELSVSYTQFNNFYYGKPSFLKEIYSAVDLLAAPSLVESFGQVSLEAASCNVPTIAFKDTGLTEIVVHKKNGYLANYKNISDFAKGLEWCFEKKNYKKLSLNSRPMAKSKFSYNIISKQYLDFYKTLQ